jgi:hypothetical protein
MSLAVLGLGADHQPGAGATAVRQSAAEIVGEAPGHERGRLGPLHRRIQVDGDRQVRWRRHRGRRARIQSAGQVMRFPPRGPEASDELGGRQRRQIAEGAQPEAHEHVDQAMRIPQVAGHIFENRDR